MRRLISPALFSLVVSGASVIATPAFAADQNAYRAGTPYLKTVANHYGQCESQCAGDAQCRSWNFVRPNAGAASGICEFNSRDSSPAQSPTSMSGAMNTRIDPALSRAVQGGTNTIRIGTPTMSVPKMATRQQQLRQQQQKRRVVRKPVPRQITARNASHTKPVNIKPSQNPGRFAPRVYGGQKQTVQRPTAPQQLKARPQQPKARPQANRANPQTNKPLTAEQAYYREQYIAQRKRQEAVQQQYQQRTQNRAPQQAMPQRQPAQYAPQGQQQRMPQRPLYGSLHDDLTRNMTIVPRPRTAPDAPNNANVPLATSRAAPTKPVTAKPLRAPIGPSLVGG